MRLLLDTHTFLWFIEGSLKYIVVSYAAELFINDLLVYLASA